MATVQEVSTRSKRWHVVQVIGEEEFEPTTGKCPTESFLHTVFTQTLF